VARSSFIPSLTTLFELHNSAILVLAAAEGQDLADQARWARLQAFSMSATEVITSALAATSARTMARFPRNMARMLLKSCAMPPANVPSASSFCAWRSCASSRRFVGNISHDPR